MRNTPRRADEHLRWLRLVGKDAVTTGRQHPATPGLLTLLPALTGGDFRALEAIDRLWELHSFCDHPAAVLRAVALVALEMQESTRPLARELIARAKDWNDRERLWPLVEAEMAKLRAEPRADHFLRTLDARARESATGLAGVEPFDAAKVFEQPAAPGPSTAHVYTPGPEIKHWRVVFRNYHPVTGTLLNSSIEVVDAESPVEAAKLIRRDGDPDKGVTARVVTSVTPDVRDPSPTLEAGVF